MSNPNGRGPIPDHLMSPPRAANQLLAGAISCL
jgi:hypothetical protein